MKKSNFLSMLILSFVLMVTIISCSKDDGPAATANTVNITDNAFNLSSLTVTKGTTVTWKNLGGTTHTVTSNDGISFNSGNLAPGGTFTHTFNTSGSFPYHCEIHSSMTASITVP